MMTQSEIQKILETLSSDKQAELLLSYGHQLTVMARDAYEFQGPGVTNPRLLRDVNEIYHRLFPQIEELVQKGKAVFPDDVMASWIAGEGRQAVQSASFKRLKKHAVCVTHNKANSLRRQKAALIVPRRSTFCHQ